MPYSDILLNVENRANKYFKKSNRIPTLNYFSAKFEIIRVDGPEIIVRPLESGRYINHNPVKLSQKRGQAAYRPRDSVRDMSKQEVASPNSYQYYDERSSSTAESPNYYNEYRFLLFCLNTGAFELFVHDLFVSLELQSFKLICVSAWG